MTKKRVIFLLCIVWQQEILPLIIGSDAAVMAQGATVLSPTDNNQIIGATVMSEGFSLENALTSCTYNSSMFVLDDVFLNGGSLYLNKDLVFSNTSRLVTGGMIFGNNHAVHLPIQIETFLLPSQDSVTAQLTEVTSLSTGKGVLSLAWSFDNNYLAVGNYFSSNTEADIYYFDGQSLTFTKGIEVGAGVYSLDWHSTHNYIAVGVLATNTDNVKIYSFEESTGITTLVDSVVMPASVYTVKWHPSGDYLFVGTNAGSDRLFVYSFNSSTGSLSFLDSVELSPNQLVYLDNIRFSSSGDYCVVGGNQGAFIFSFNGSSLSQVTYESLGFVYAVDWFTLDDLVALGLSSGNRLQLYQFDDVGGSLIAQSEENPAETQSIFRAEWSPVAPYLATGSIGGYNSFIRLYSLSTTPTFLERIQTIAVSGSVYGARWSSSGNYLAVALSNRDLKVFRTDTQVDLIFDHIVLELNSPVSVTRPLTASGKTKINGNGNILSLAHQQAQFLIDDGGELTIENTHLVDVTSENFGFKTDNGQLILRNCSIRFDTDYSFSLGAFCCQEQVVFKGGNQVSLESAQVNKVEAGAHLVLEEGIVLRYAPVTNSRNNFLLDSQALVTFKDGTSLYTTETGLYLDQGTLLLDGSVTFSSKGRALSEQLVLTEQVNVLLMGTSELSMHGYITYD